MMISATPNAMIVYIHPTCSTCKKGIQWLDTQQYRYQTIDIRQTPPPKEMFEKILANGVKRTSLLNTSGNLYKELGIKDKLPMMSDEELAALLSQNGMLIKRPVICYNDVVTFGSREKMLEEVWKNDEI